MEVTIVHHNVTLILAMATPALTLTLMISVKMSMETFAIKIQSTFFKNIF